MRKPLHNIMVASAIILVGYAMDAIATVDPSQKIEAFKHSWIARALQLQREIDQNASLNEATFVGTHNSYNAKSYEIPFVRYIDPNQILSIYQQLEMGIRSIEFDAHWTLSNHFSKAILLCHGEQNHLGCSVFDRPIEDGLQEIRAWLLANPNEVVLLYIEAHLDGHKPRLADQLEHYLGAFIFKPVTIRKKNEDPTGCVALPTSLTKKVVLNTGKQLIIVTKGCDGVNSQYEEEDKYTTPWNDEVFAGIGNIPTAAYSFIDATIDHFTPYPDCGYSTLFHLDKAHTSLWRIYEDRTWLSHATHPQKQILAKDIQELMHCNINWPAIDKLDVDDPRLFAIIWSWAPSYPKEEDGKCAIYQYGEGIRNFPCDHIVEGFACQEDKTHAMYALISPGTFANGEFLCQRYGKNGHFGVPINGYQMGALKESMTRVSMQTVWLNYAVDNTGHWIAHYTHVSNR